MRVNRVNRLVIGLDYGTTYTGKRAPPVVHKSC